MRRHLKRFAPGVAAMVCLAAAAIAGSSIVYAPTKTVEQIDDYHGTKVKDPYRWLENDVRQSPEVAAWVEAQNKVTFGYLESIPERSRINSALTRLWNYEKYSAPFREGSRYFFSKNDGLQNQSVLYVQESLTGEPRMLMDPNTLSPDGTVALAGIAISDDARYMAYGLATAGSDWSEWRVRDINSGKDTEDILKWIKFSGTSWTKDGKGFYYGRYDEPKAGEQYQAKNLYHKVYFHTLGAPQSQDALVYENKNEPEWTFGADVSEDGKYVFMGTSKSTDPKNLISYKELDKPGAEWVHLVKEWEADYTPVGNDGPVFFFKTDLDSPKARLIAIDSRNPAKANWKTIIPEAPEVLRGVSFVNNQFIASYLKDAVTRVRVFDVGGKHVRDIEFPGLGSAGGFGGERDYTETFYTFSSFAVPPSIYRLDLTTGKSTLMRQAKVDMNPADFETKEVFVPSKGGAKVPMFITHRKGLVLDGKNPTILYGYGGFNVANTPGFSPTNVLWLKMGGVYASACMRGGGEYGKDWHEAGKLLSKQNVFDDFIASAEWLIANKYTSPRHLGIRGGSNGGLLVGAVETQRPDLFGACVPAVGVMDMLRYQNFTAGRFWVAEYGGSDDSKMFPYLLGYSPYHQLLARAQRAYPPTLITTADTDDRVVPGHSFKYAAAIQAMQSGDAPVLIRIETKAGHGAGKPTAKIIEEASDVLAFLSKNLGAQLPAELN